MSRPRPGRPRLRVDDSARSLALPALAVFSVLLSAAGHALGAELAPFSVQVLPLLLAGLLLDAQSVRRLCAVVAAVCVVDLWTLGIDVVRPGAVVTVALTGLAVHEFARSRQGTGLAGLSGDALLVELRGRLARQSALPALPAGWQAESVLRPAGGGPFAGDFVISALRGSHLELALVDVSGKGLAAGTRALLLSGAMGGLLGAVPAADFLSAANGYLNRQDWDEGFATAVHLALDLSDGSFVIASAGHPPVAHFDAGSGRWSLLPTEGAALGLLPDVACTPARGRLRRGDALLLYTDGLVEVPGRDLAVGIDKLLGEAERLVPRGFAGGGDVLVNRVAPRADDDRGLVLLWRQS